MRSAELNRLREQLDAAYRRVNANLAHNPDLRFEGERPRCVSSRQARGITKPRFALRRDVQARLPKGDLPDILLEVCAHTRLAESFTHVSERGARVADFPISLAAVLVAERCNIGFEPLIQPRHCGAATRAPLLGKPEFHPRRDPARGQRQARGQP